MSGPTSPLAAGRGFVSRQRAIVKRRGGPKTDSSCLQSAIAQRYGPSARRRRGCVAGARRAVRGQRALRKAEKWRRKTGPRRLRGLIARRDPNRGSLRTPGGTARCQSTTAGPTRNVCLRGGIDRPDMPRGRSTDQRGLNPVPVQFNGAPLGAHEPELGIVQRRPPREPIEGLGVPRVLGIAIPSCLRAS